MTHHSRHPVLIASLALVGFALPSAQLLAADWMGEPEADTVVFTGNGEMTANGVPLTDINVADAVAGDDTIRFNAAQSHPEALEYRNFEFFTVDFNVGFPVFTAPRVVVSGELSFDNFSGTYQPGQVFQLINAPVIEGSFSAFDLPDVSAQKLAWSTESLPTRGELRLVSNEPPVAITERSEPLGLVSRDTSQVIGSEYQPASPPLLTNNYRFGFWAFNGTRQENPLGRSYIRPNVLVTEPIDAIAHYFEDGEDGDGDRLDDWWEFWMFGNRERGPQENLDGDAFIHEVEFQRGFDPLLIDRVRGGGVSLRLSRTADFVKTGAYRFTLTSDPPGLQQTSGRIVVGQPYTSPHLEGEMNEFLFAGFLVDGVRQSDSSGLFLNQLTFAPNADFDVTAQYFHRDADEDQDGLLDAYEIQRFGDFDQSAQTDFDQDGITDGVEYTRGLAATAKDEPRSGGISLRLSSSAVFAVGKSRFAVRSQPLGLIEPSEEYVDNGTIRTLANQRPTVPPGFEFGYWALNGQRWTDAAGLSRRGGDLAINVDTEAVAHFFPTDQDADDDGLVDWREWFQSGTLDFGPDDDPDDDGIPADLEQTRGLSVALKDDGRSGGVSLRLSQTAFYAGALIRYTQRSQPLGLIANAVGHDAVGTTITSPRLNPATPQSGYYFVYWTLNGTRLADFAGVSRSQAVFTLTEPTEMVAHFVLADGDEDQDGLLDQNELRYAQSLDSLAPVDDPDNDTLPVYRELDQGLNPLTRDWLRSGGVALRFSSLGAADFTLELDGFYDWIRQRVGDTTFEEGLGVHLLEDFDGDGIPNILEYAHGLEPTLVDDAEFRERVLQMDPSSSQARLRLATPPTTPQRVRYDIQYSTNLRSWFTMSRSEFNIEQEERDNLRWETLTPNHPPSGPVFYRLRIHYE